MHMNQDLVSYYKDRAKEYEKIYFKPERHADLMRATEIFQTIFSNKNILEIACGTGYWTEKILESANSIYATDINETVIKVAQQKNLNNNVKFEVADFYKLKPSKKYESLFGGFIWSHILIQDLDEFVKKINELVVENGNVVFIDNNYVAGSSTPITQTDEFGNTFQTRKLENDTLHSVLKNFPAKEFIIQKLSNIAIEVEFINMDYFWIANCKLK